MKRARFVSFFLWLTTSFLLSQSNPIPLVNSAAKVAPPSVVSSANASQANASQADPKAQARILEAYGKLPLSFEANQGQADARVKFLSRTAGYTLFLTGNEAVLALRGKAKNRRANAVGHVAKSSPPRLKPASLAGLSGTVRQDAEKLRFVSGHRFSDAVGSSKSKASLGAGPWDHPAADRTAGAVLRMKLRNANPAAKVTGADELAGKSNYFIGTDPAKWRTNVPTYAKVRYEAIYPGIDLIYYGNQRQLEYDFVVAPGADPHRIAFDVKGAKRVRRDARGDLVLKVGDGEIRWHKPVVYQEKNGTRQEIAAHYAITDGNRVRFELSEYDASRALYIDPLIYSTHLGGSGYDYGSGIAVDSDGNAYVVGRTTSTDFPVTPGAFETICNGGSNCFDGDLFVTKINPSGSALVYSTYLGGSGQEGSPYIPDTGIAVDSAGNAYIVGMTASTDFPTTPGAFQTTYRGNGDAFVAKINASGSALAYSTYLGGSSADQGDAIAVDSVGNAYVTGYTGSTDFPVTPGAFQTTCGGQGDAFVAKVNPSGSALVYSTYLGGSGPEPWDLASIALDSAGNAYVTGGTGSADFPVTFGAFQTTLGGGYQDAFVTKINASGSGLVYSTYLGGSGQDFGLGIAVDNSGNAYATGYTQGENFPTTPGAFQTACYLDAYVTKLNAFGSLVYSTCLGGSTQDMGWGIAVDGVGNAYITGHTFSPDFPTTLGAFQTKCARNTVYCYTYGDAFVARLNPTGSGLVYSTYLGGDYLDLAYGIATDSGWNAYVTGHTGSTNFPTKNPLALRGSAFVTKLDVRAVPIIALTSSLNPSTYGQAVTFTAALTSSIGAPPDGKTITFMQGTRVLGTGTLSGGSATFTTSTLTAGTKYIKAVYGGDANFGPSSSKVLKQVVYKATTTTTLTSSLNPSTYGQAVTFTATPTPQYSGTVKGTVTFYDGTTVLATKSLSGGVAKFTTSTLAQGTHTITATYNGNANFLGSSASLTQTVN